MKPGSREVPVRVLIAGAELDALHELTGAMSESYGLDRRIQRYQGKRPIALYSWDLDLLVDVSDVALGEAEDRQPQGARSPGARRTAVVPLRSLLARLRTTRDEADRADTARGRA